MLFVSVLLLLLMQVFSAENVLQFSATNFKFMTDILKFLSMAMSCALSVTDLGTIRSRGNRTFQLLTGIFNLRDIDECEKNDGRSSVFGSSSINLRINGIHYFRTVIRRCSP